MEAKKDNFLKAPSSRLKRPHDEQRKMDARKAQKKALIFKTPTLFKRLTNWQCLAHISTGGFMLLWGFISVLHNKVIYFWEILVEVSPSLRDQQLTLSLAAWQDLPLFHPELLLNVSSILCANVLFFSAGPVTFLGSSSVIPETHTQFLYHTDRTKIASTENGIVTLTADKVLDHVLSH